MKWAIIPLLVRHNYWTDNNSRCHFQFIQSSYNRVFIFRSKNFIIYQYKQIDITLILGIATSLGTIKNNFCFGNNPFKQLANLINYLLMSHSL